ncbi:DUF3883 domain-containing protein [Bradyrhizobium sp. SZCCHNR2028]|uniref:DUF3883 domain-containing protein n=1 Tax=Bradyrhizobium sp. SZCCHNR2028 TaxID=3057382 RepID=UPI0028F1523A|nr:DUF3883 domain-containing protein [Bradyrhizobium sp. SZCCHNR2028]
MEVKTTNGWERTPFYVTRNELAVAEAYRDDWRLMRPWNFASAPRAFELRPPLRSACVADGDELSGQLSITISPTARDPST